MFTLSVNFCKKPTGRHYYLISQMRNWVRMVKWLPKVNQLVSVGEGVWGWSLCPCPSGTVGGFTSSGHGWKMGRGRKSREMDLIFNVTQGHTHGSLRGIVRGLGSGLPELTCHAETFARLIRVIWEMRGSGVHVCVWERERKRGKMRKMR